MTPKATPSRPSIVIFDLGGVLVDWNPRHLMNVAISEDARREYFLANVLTSDFLQVLDAAKDSRVAVTAAMKRHPDYAHEISTYIERFHETIDGEFPEMADLVQRLDAAGVAQYGLTNWAGDTFDLTRPRLPTLALLRDIVVSGHEGIVKPDHRIFALLCARGDFTASDSVFIDDSLRNVDGARAFGMAGIHHRSAKQTIAELRALGLPA
jgi:2-haloacid dehalogenase